MILDVFTAIVGLIGLAMLGYGLFLVYPPAMFVVVGIILLLWSFAVSKTVAANKTAKEANQ